MSLAAVLLMLTASQLQAQDWLTYSSKRGKFKVLFPGKPEVVDEPKDWGKSYKAQVKLDEHLFYSSYGIHEQRLVDHAHLSEVSTEAFAEKIGGTIIDESAWKFKGHQGRQLELTIPDKNVRIYYKVILIGQIQYQLVAGVPIEGANDKWVKKFFKSFKLL